MVETFSLFVDEYKKKLCYCAVEITNRNPKQMQKGVELLKLKHKSDTFFSLCRVNTENANVPLVIPLLAALVSLVRTFDP